LLALKIYDYVNDHADFCERNCPHCRGKSTVQDDGRCKKCGKVDGRVFAKA
jgi:hypothetical protein